MSWRVCAWRGNDGHASIDIGTLYGGSDYNTVVDFSISSEEELERFIGECRAAWKRASEATEPLFEEMPDPYVSDWYKATAPAGVVSDVVIKAGDCYPPIRLADTEGQTGLEPAARVRYIAVLPNRCVVRGDLKVLDAQTGIVEAAPATLPAGTKVEIEILWSPSEERMTFPGGIVVAS